MNQALMILAQGYDEHGELDSETILRLEKGIEYLDDTSFILLPGYEKQTGIMKRWLLERVEVKIPIYEVLAHDTIGQAVFSFPVIKALGAEKLLVVTSDFHVGRTKVIFEKIYKEVCQLGFTSSDSLKNDIGSQLIKEEASLKLFQMNFGSAVTYFDYVAILLDHHPKYQHVRLVAIDEGTDSDDALLVWEWRNDPETRKMSRKSDLISFDEHQQWWQSVLKDPSKVILMAFVNGMKAGMVRIDLFDEKKAEVNININPCKRGKGIGYAVLAEACRYAKDTLNLVELVAEVKPENVGSIAIFEKGGFTFDGLFDGLRKYRLKL